MPDLRTINTWARPVALPAFAACCGSPRWAEQMVAHRPYGTTEALLSEADRIWAALPRTEWLEAFGAHPRIGDLDALRSRFAGDRWAGDEQSGAAQASDTVLERLSDGNRRYEERFGYIFIICATGKSAAVMLANLEERLKHRPAEELTISAEQQRQITRLRLEKLLKD